MKSITLEIISGFMEYLIENERSENTIEKYMRDVRCFFCWLKDRNIEKSIVLKYKTELCEKYAPKSVNSILSALNSFFVYINRHELKVKTLKIQREIFADREKELTKSEYEKLLNAAKEKGKERLYYLMQTICSTGIRVSELKYITCQAVNTGRAVINCKGKIRKVFLPGQLCKMLKGYIRRCGIKDGSVFVTKKGKPIDRYTVWKMLKRLCEFAGVSAKKVFPHNLRHLFAKTFYSVQKDIVRLADVLGHSSIETTRIYTIESGDTHIRLLQSLGLLMNKKIAT